MNCKTQQSVLMPIYVITLISMTMCSLKISAFSINHWVAGVVMIVFLNFLTVKFLNSFWARSALLLYWKELKNLWQSVKSLNLIWTSNLLQLVYACEKGRDEILSRCRKWILQVSVMKYNVCWMAALAEDNLLLRGSWDMYLSVGTAIVNISNKNLPLGGNIAWSIKTLRSFQFHGMHNSVMSMCPSWPIIYKLQHMERVSVEIRVSDGNCQIFYCNFSGFSTSIISKFMPFFTYQAPTKLFYIWHCNIIMPSTSWCKYLYWWQNFIFKWEMSERITVFDEICK